jgi:hypothetical protein
VIIAILKYIAYFYLSSQSINGSSMKKFSGIRSLLLMPVLLLCCSCANEIRLFPENIPSEYMVFGILDANSDNQYIKIRKTFGGNSDLPGMTGNSELFSPPVTMTVKVEEWKEEDVVIHELSRDLIPKQPGLFDTDNNIIYSGIFAVMKGVEYHLFIEDASSGLEIKASTIAIEPPRLRFPMGGHIFNFADTLNPFYVKYEPTGSVHLQQFFINFAELLNTGDTIFRTVRFDLNPRFKHPERPVLTYTRNYSKDYILNIMRMLILPDDDVAERQLYSFDIIVWAGDQYLKDYLQLADNYNDNRKQFFSNIEGGMGIFAACSHTSIEEMYPRQSFFDTIANASRLAGLHFSNMRFSGDFKKKAVAGPELLKSALENRSFIHSLEGE